MNTNNVEFILAMITLGTLSLAISIYVVNWMVHTLKTPDVPLSLRITSQRRGTSTVRGRTETKPGIVCSLPIHQPGRQDDLRI